MNRKQRRATRTPQKALAAVAGPPPVAGSSVDRMFAEALWYQHHANLSEAAKVFKRLLAEAPNHAETARAAGLFRCDAKHSPRFAMC